MRARSAATLTPPSLTLNVNPQSAAYPDPSISSHASRSPKAAGDRAKPLAPTLAYVLAHTYSHMAPSPRGGGGGRAHDWDHPAMAITARSISKIVSLDDLQQLVRRMETHPPPPPSPSQRDGSGDNGAWSDGVPTLVEHLGEGTSGVVQAVQDTRTGKRLARKTIITHEGPLKQLIRELVFLSRLRHINIVHFHGAYMSPSNSEVKFVMELCEGGNLATIGEKLRRRKVRVAEKVACALVEGVCDFFFLRVSARASRLTLD